LLLPLEHRLLERTSIGKSPDFRLIRGRSLQMSFSSPFAAIGSTVMRMLRRRLKKARREHW
jgi:hypothetical protein